MYGEDHNTSPEHYMPEIPEMFQKLIQFHGEIMNSICRWKLPLDQGQHRGSPTEKVTASTKHSWY